MIIFVIFFDQFDSKVQEINAKFFDIVFKESNFIHVDFNYSTS